MEKENKVSYATDVLVDDDRAAEHVFIKSQAFVCACFTHVSILAQKSCPYGVECGRGSGQERCVSCVHRASEHSVSFTSTEYYESFAHRRLLK